MLPLIFIIIGNIFNGYGVYINMKYSPRLGDLKIIVDGGSADRKDDPDKIHRRKRKEEDEENDMGYKWVLAGIIVNLAAGLILLFDYISSL